jgi:hypothetical protein
MAAFRAALMLEGCRRRKRRGRYKRIAAVEVNV